MTKISLQAIFNAAWQAFIVEGKEPANDGGGCRYLTPSGKKCAVGLCIPDGHEAQRFTGGFYNLAHSYPELFDEEILNASWTRLNDLQGSLHDNLQTKGKWLGDVNARRSQYVGVAKAFGLSVPVEVVA